MKTPIAFRRTIKTNI